MAKVAERDRSKLPQWVQDAFAKYERDITTLQDTLDAERTRRPDSPVVARDTIHHTERGLDAVFETVRFYVGEERRPDDNERKYWIEVARREDGRVELRASDTLVLTPNSTNYVVLDIADRLEHTPDSGVRNLGQRLMQELRSKGLEWQDGLNLIYDADVEALKAARGRRREAR